MENPGSHVAVDVCVCLGGGVLHLCVFLFVCSAISLQPASQYGGPGHSPESSGNLTDCATQAGDACSSPLLWIVSPSLFGQAGTPTQDE